MMYGTTNRFMFIFCKSGHIFTYGSMPSFFQPALLGPSQSFIFHEIPVLDHLIWTVTSIHHTVLYNLVSLSPISCGW